MSLDSIRKNEVIGAQSCLPDYKEVIIEEFIANYEFKFSDRWAGSTHSLAFYNGRFSHKSSRKEIKALTNTEVSASPAV